MSYYLVLVADTVEVTVDICRKELQKGVAVLRALILLTSTLMALQIAEAMGVVTGLAATYAARTSARLGDWYCILLRCVSCMAYVGKAEFMMAMLLTWERHFYVYRFPPIPPANVR